MQGAEKHVLPILLIILVLVALVSTYAWFFATTSKNVAVEIGAGEPTSFAITDGAGQSVDGVYHYGGETPSVENMYNGQIGYNESGVAYNDDNAPFRIYPKIPFAVSGASTLRIVVGFDKLIVTVGNRYNYTFNESLTNICGVANIGSITVSDYIVLNSSFTANNSLEPSTGTQNIFLSIDDEDANYVANDTSTYKVKSIIYKSEVVQNYMTYDYWISSQSASEPTNNHGSGKTTGYMEYVSDGSGDDAYMCVMIGFYGYDSTNEHYTPCIFAGNKFRGSSFTFIMSAGGV